MADSGASGIDKPDWWRTNERLREEMDLPPYQPPRFEDGVPTFVVTKRLEKAHDCCIRFQGKNTDSTDDLQVTVDRQPVMSVGRHRDHNSNTVFEIDSTRFEAVIARLLRE